MIKLPTSARGWRPSMLAVLAAISCSTEAAAQTALMDTPDAFGTVFRAWSNRHDIGHGFIVVRHGHQIVHRTSLGGADPAAPVHLASLSKAITGACIATLVRDGRLSFETPLASALAKFMTRSGARVDPRLRRVTVAQLLVHRAGFGTGKDDPGSGSGLMEYLEDHPADARPSPEFLAWALSQKLEHAPGTKFVYSNTGYLALGTVVEEASGMPYAPHCREAVLTPLGLAGELEPSWRVMWSYGGWRMAARHYLAFLDLFDTDDPRLGTVAKAWMLDPAGKTAGAADSWYGLGTFVHKAGRGVDISHVGSWAYTAAGINRASRTNFLTLAVRQSDGTAWFVHVTPRPSHSEDERPAVELRRALVEAYRGVRRWN
jgi:CubicO group peptidase (beta-lactamase class C family)